MRTKKMSIIAVVLIIVLLLIGVVGCGDNGGEKETVIKIGGKNFSEQFIMAEMLSILIEENTDIKTDVTTNLAANVIYGAIQSKDIDLYLEYTGTGLINLGKEVVFDPKEVYDIVQEEFQKQFNVKWMKPYGFNNTYAMVVTKDIAEKYNLKTTSDMAKVGEELILGCTHVFTERDDGYPGLSKHYGFEFKDVKGMDPSLMYQALIQDDVQVISAFATEGRIAAFDLVILEDDKQFFPPYDAAPIIRMEVLEEHPELEDILNSLANLIDDVKMAELNAAVDLDKREPEEVAREFLEKNGLI